MGSKNSRGMADEDSSSDSSLSSSPSESVCNRRDYAQILQTLINKRVRMDTQERQSNRRRPSFVQPTPNTSLLDKSDFAMMTKLSSGETEPKLKKPKNVVNMLMNREKGVFPGHNFSNNTRCRIVNKYVPNEFDIMDGYAGKVFCGIFSKDGERFITASQDRNLKIYSSGDGSYDIEKSMVAKDVGWSIIDLECSPDNRHFVYSTWSSSVYLCNMASGNDDQRSFLVADTGRRCCIFSVSFSADGRELLCGSNDGFFYVHDLQSNRRILKLLGHKLDVNCVAFPEDSSSIFYTAGDDGIINLWDRRTSSERYPTPVGYLAGHANGITYMDLRGDGRHLITNSKDQSIKLWDVRVLSASDVVERSYQSATSQNWDYRWQEVPRRVFQQTNPIEGDSSIMTYRGHSVMKTLIRCKFSPMNTTGQRYIYTGCGMGRVVVYDALTGKAVQHQAAHVSCVRDVSWHPTRNEILSSGWDGIVGMWTHLDPNNVTETEQIEIDRKHGNSFKLENGFLVNPARRSKRIADRARENHR